MSKTTFTMLNTPSEQAIKNAWQVIANHYSKEMGVKVTPIFKSADDKKKIAR